MNTSFIFLALSILDIAGLLLAVLLCLDVVWRTRGRLDIFAKLLTASVVIRLTERLIPLLRFDELIHPANFWPGLLTDLILIIAFAELYRLVRNLNGETKN